MEKETQAVHLKACVTGLLGVLTALWGWFGWLIFVWAGLMLADWLVGSAAAFKEGKWSSAKLRAGAWHKGGMVIIVCVALVADWLIGTLIANLPGVILPFEYSVLLGPLVIVWYIIGELGSLAEHAVTMGARVPSWLPRILAIGQEAVNTAGERFSCELTKHSGEAADASVNDTDAPAEAATYKTDLCE